MRVFRLWRDDAYIASLLAVLCALRTRHVLTGAAPAGVQFLGSPGQSEALARTVQIARGAAVVAEPGCAAAGGGGGADAEGEGGGGAGDAADAILTPPLCADGSNASAFWPAA
jgi:hypothetical protein